MGRFHTLIGWIVVFGFLTAVSLHAADKSHARPPAEKAPPSLIEKTVDDIGPFAAPNDKPVKKGPAAKDGRTEQLKSASSPVKRKPAKTPATQPHSFAHRDMPASDNVAAIERALASPAHLEFVDVPLQNVVDSLKDRYQIEIQLDTRFLVEMSSIMDTSVTINVKAITLKSALRLMLRNMQPELTYIIQDEVLLITTPDIAAEQLITRVYPVGDLVACWDEHGVPWDDYEALIDVIKSTIKPIRESTVITPAPIKESTVQAPIARGLAVFVGGQTVYDEFTRFHDPGSIAGNTLGTAKVLVVLTTDENHEKIADLLAKIREIAKRSPNADPPRRNRPGQAGHGNMPKEKPPVVPGGGMF
jgi:hypothetical protein